MTEGFKSLPVSIKTDKQWEKIGAGWQYGGEAFNCNDGTGINKLATQTHTRLIKQLNDQFSTKIPPIIDNVITIRLP